MSVIQQTRILRRIKQHFGSIDNSQIEELNEEEQQIFNFFLQQLAVAAEEDLDDFGDEPSSPESQSSQQPSGSEYVPTPTKRHQMLEDEYMAKAYNY